MFYNFQAVKIWSTLQQAVLSNTRIACERKHSCHMSISQHPDSSVRGYVLQRLFEMWVFNMYHALSVYHHRLQSATVDLTG